MGKKSEFSSGIPWLLTGAAITLLAVVLLKPTTISHAQSSRASSEVGTYQIASFSISYDRCGFFIMDTRNGKVINCEIDEFRQMEGKYGKGQ